MLAARVWYKRLLGRGARGTATGGPAEAAAATSKAAALAAALSLQSLEWLVRSSCPKTQDPSGLTTVELADQVNTPLRFPLNWPDTEKQPTGSTKLQSLIWPRTLHCKVDMDTTKVLSNCANGCTPQASMSDRNESRKVGA